MARSENNLKAVLQDTADAIKLKKGTSAKICPRDFADEIGDISTGITPTGTINITENGSDIDVTQYASANVSVSGYPEPSGEIAITNVGYHNVKDYATANVHVPYLNTATFPVFGYTYNNNVFSEKILLIEDSKSTNLIDVELNETTCVLTGNFYGVLPGLTITDDSGPYLSIDYDWFETSTSDLGSTVYRYRAGLIVPSSCGNVSVSYDFATNFRIENETSYTLEEISAYLQSEHPDEQVEIVDLLGNIIVTMSLESLISGGGDS